MRREYVELMNLEEVTGSQRMHLCYDFLLTSNKLIFEL